MAVIKNLHQSVWERIQSDQVGPRLFGNIASSWATCTINLRSKMISQRECGKLNVWATSSLLHLLVISHQMQKKLNPMIGPPPIFSSHKDVPVFFLCPGVTESFVLEEKKKGSIPKSFGNKTTENKTSTKQRYSYPPLLSVNSPSHTNWTNDSKGSSWLFINSFSCAFRIVRMSASASETYTHHH